MIRIGRENKKDYDVIPDKHITYSDEADIEATLKSYPWVLEQYPDVFQSCIPF